MSSANKKRLDQLNPDQIQSYRDQFEMFDLNGDGVISARELRKVSRKLGYRMTEQQLDVSIIYQNAMIVTVS